MKAKITYPRFSQLSVRNRGNFGNGCGAQWMPQWTIDLLFGWFFTASCRCHDFGYTVGGNELRRIYCDWQFAKAMYRDTKRFKQLSKRILASIAMVAFYLAVALFGWARFNYGVPKTLGQITKECNQWQ